MHGFPNELAAADRNFALGGLVVVLLRLYGIDPRADLSRPELEPWGYVPPVRVSARVLGTISPTATDLVWQTYPECPANNTLVVRDALTAVTNVRGTAGAPRASLIYCILPWGSYLILFVSPVPTPAQLVNTVDVQERSCPSENVANNFMLYRPDDTGLTTRTPFANTQDASFLLACANHRPGYRKGSDLIAVVRARLPVTPVGLADAPYVGDPAVGVDGSVGV